MSCPKAAEMMCLAFDDDGPDDHPVLQEHLAECSECAAEWQALRAVDRLLVQVKPVEPPAMLALRVMQGVAKHRRQHARLRAGSRLIYALLGMLSLVGAPALFVTSLLRDNPSLAASLVGLYAHMVDMLRGVAGAVAIFGRAALGDQLLMLAMCWVLLMGLVMFVSLRLLAAARTDQLGA